MHTSYKDPGGNVITFRNYVPDKDVQATIRLLREIRWVAESDSNAEKWVDTFFSAGRTLVGEVNGFFESIVASVPGDFKYRDKDLKLSAVTTVATGLGARRRGLGLNLTAHLLAMDTMDGADVAMLGVFDQGFYDRLGFGAGPYTMRVCFEPDELKDLGKARPAMRFTEDDVTELHAAMVSRYRGHAGVNLYPASFAFAVFAEAYAEENPVILGYRDGTDGTASHFLWGKQTDENGPLKVAMLVWRTTAELRELLSLIGSLGDSIWLVDMSEPASVQIQAMVKRPLKRMGVSKGGKFESGVQGEFDWAFRILNLERCVGQVSLASASIAFNLHLSDPVRERLPESTPWRGCAGEWTIRFAESSSAVPGHTDDLPTMQTSVGTFTRLWAGVSPASALSISDDLKAPDSLLADLDRHLVLPALEPGWSF